MTVRPVATERCALAPLASSADVLEHLEPHRCLGPLLHCAQLLAGLGEGVVVVPGRPGVLRVPYADDGALERFVDALEQLCRDPAVGAARRLDPGMHRRIPLFGGPRPKCRPGDDRHHVRCAPLLWPRLVRWSYSLYPRNLQVTP